MNKVVNTRVKELESEIERLQNEIQKWRRSLEYQKDKNGLLVRILFNEEMLGLREEMGGDIADYDHEYVSERILMATEAEVAEAEMAEYWKGTVWTTNRLRWKNRADFFCPYRTKPNGGMVTGSNVVWTYGEETH